ncbi:hypothetical protein [Paracoccus sp. N5]|uniref:hypothetical protein n=1 Tax=Paracoccus sp. N5 TaxID=1101189 RepID=UPI0018DED8A1|nr:hypothetical protein [Paracoccus sp. N5]
MSETEQQDELLDGLLERLRRGGLDGQRPDRAADGLWSERVRHDRFGRGREGGLFSIS